MSDDEPQNASSANAQTSTPKKTLRKGVVLDKNGKPCRTCTSVRDLKKQIASLPSDCPPDVETLGRSTWTLLHSIAATYPSTASPAQQNEMRSFITLFSRLYPCWVCAEDFQGYIEAPENRLRVVEEGRSHLSGRNEFGLWMCNAHNDVNRKLGKKEFDCAKWEERWRTGWKDGRCD